MNASNNGILSYDLASVNITNIDVYRGNLHIHNFLKGEINIENLEANLTSEFWWDNLARCDTA